MTEHIDHAAEARRIMSKPWSVESKAAAFAEAEVHATLALVEQQRIANLIAYCAAADTLCDGHKEWIEKEWGLS